MKLKDMFTIAIEAAMDADPRPKKEILAELRRTEERQKELQGMEKEYADPERTKNPYADSRIHYGTGEEEVRNLLVGIDVKTPELLLASELRRNGEKIDAVFAHHPEGRALADLEKVLPMQVDIYKLYGVAENQAEGCMRPRMEAIWRSIHANNLFREERVAELLGIPFFGCHTITDNLVWRFMEDTICTKKFRTVGEVLEALYEIPEYQLYAKAGNPPIIVNGSKEGRTGKLVASEFTGGTNGPEDLIELQAKANVGTILTMHITDKSLEIAKKNHINIIQCSHMASDALGVNLLLDIWKKRDPKLRFIAFSGFVRVERSARSTRKPKGKVEKK